MTAPTFSQIKAQVAAIRQKTPDAQIIGIRAQGRWTGDRLKHDGSKTYLIEQCDSPLAMRLALHETHSEPAITVLLTSLNEADLGDDILLRLARRKLHLIDSWQIIKTLFRANSIDPRLMQAPWIADYLMDWVPPAGYPSVSGGFLDAETVWFILINQGIGLTDYPPDLLAILNWSTDADNVAKLKAAPDVFRRSAVDWLTSIAGSATRTVLHCILSSDCPDALPVGLALEVLLHPDVNGRLDKAIGKLEERYLGGSAIDSHSVFRWGQSATACLQQFNSDQKHQLLQRTDKILLEIGAESFAYLSHTSPTGFEQRLATLGKCLGDTLKTKKTDFIKPIHMAHESVLNHDRAKAPSECRRLNRIAMAIRLMKWMASQKMPKPTESLAEAMMNHQTEGGFVDWARLSLRWSESIRELSEAYAILFNQVSALREQQAFQFATLLQNWVEVGSTGKAVLPVEHILETTVAPLASHASVLVIVMDGMSMAACRELVADITAERRWVSLCQDKQTSAVTAGLAAIPSTTEVSRTSLLCGHLRQGKSPDEKKGFAVLPSLLAHCRYGSPPILFHKDALREQDGVLADVVRNAIKVPQNRVVGVVINAIDDYLAKGDQLDVQWSQDEIKVLSILLYEAKASNRLVILLSDHGHVFDHQTDDDKTVKKSSEGGERWRLDDGHPKEGELRIKGSRVALPNLDSLIAPWTERLRYRSKNNGYHGGISPQEMIVPIAVLCSSTTYPAGWIEAPVDTPLWWEEQIAPIENVSPLMVSPQPIIQADFGPLFSVKVEFEVPHSTQQPSQWIIDLLASPIYKSRKNVAGRTLPGDDVLAKALLAMDDSGGKITLNALSRIIGYPIVRVRSLLIIMQRILNIDGYVVVALDSMLDIAKLDRDILHQQFSLKKE